MKTQTLVKLFVVGLSVCISTSASAAGLLGKHYIGAEILSQNWGESYSMLEDELGRSYGAGVVGNYNLAENWDFNVSCRGIWDSYDTMITSNAVSVDVEQQTVLAGLNYLFANNSSITPYLGGSAGMIRAKIDTGTSDTESDAAFAARLGAEWDVCAEAFLDVAAVYDYFDSELPEDKGNYGVQVMAGTEIIEHLLLVGSGKYMFEEGASIFTVGVVIVQ